MKFKGHVNFNDPDLVVRTYQNTIGNILWEKVGTGIVEATLPAMYGEERIHICHDVLGIDLESALQCVAYVSAPNKIQLASQNDTGDHVDWFDVSVEFEIFPESTVAAY